MRICGKQIVFLSMIVLALSGCGGAADDGSTGGPNNLPPVIGGTPTTQIVAGSQYSFTPQAADPNGNTLTFSIQNKPSWASFAPSTGAITGTPTESDVGTTGMITIEVSDSQAVAELAPFSIEVMTASPPLPGEVNLAPTILGTPATSATVGTLYTFTPVASD